MAKLLLRKTDSGYDRDQGKKLFFRTPSAQEQCGEDDCEEGRRSSNDLMELETR